jgi:MFS family permease
MACALSKNTASILIFRFLGGCFAASPLANSGAVMADVWDARIRGKALTLFALGPFAGPALGPAVGGFIGDSGASWRCVSFLSRFISCPHLACTTRWLFWTLTIFSGVVLVLVILTLPETYAPTILKRKAKRRRMETGNDKWRAPLEVVSVPLTERLSEIIGKPFKLFFQEPMLFAITMYLAFTYGCLVCAANPNITSAALISPRCSTYYLRRIRSSSRRATISRLVSQGLCFSPYL